MSQIRKKERKNWFYSYNMIFDLPVSEHAKIVYLYLCRCADTEDQAFPSYGTMAKKCSISRRTAIRAIQELEEVGLLTKEERTILKNGKPVNTSNLYTIYDCPNEVNEGVVSEGHPPSVTQSLPLVPHSHQVVSHSHSEGLPNEGLPITKSVSQSVSLSIEPTDRRTDRPKSINQSSRELSKTELVLTELIARTKIHNEPTLQELWLPVFEYMIFAPTFPAAVNRPKGMILNRIQQITRETLYNAYRRVDTHLKLTGTQVTNSVAYLAVALYNEIGRESADNGLAFASSNYCSDEEIDDFIATLSAERL